MKRILSSIALLFFGVISAFGITSRDIDVPLNEFTQIPVEGRNLRIAVHDHGSETISVAFNYSQPLRFKKADGFEEKKTNLTLIYTSGETRVYYVNTTRARMNMCVLRIESGK